MKLKKVNLLENSIETIDNIENFIMEKTPKMTYIKYSINFKFYTEEINSFTRIYLLEDDEIFNEELVKQMKEIFMKDPKFEEQK